jgi:hypothetical protein
MTTTTPTTTPTTTATDDDDDKADNDDYYNIEPIKILHSPQVIADHNAVGLCCERTCDQKEKQFRKVRLFGMDLHVVLCDKHAEIIDDAIHHKHLEYLKRKRKRRTTTTAVAAAD